MDKLKGILKSKTMLFSLALSVVGVAQANSEVFSGMMTPKHFGWFTLAIGIISAVLRWVTTQPLDEK